MELPEEYRLGQQARRKGLSSSDCPFDMPAHYIEGLGYGVGHNQKIIDRHWWLAGWNDQDLELK